MELAHPVVEVLAQPVAVADELAQGLGLGVVQPRGHRALLEGKPREARRVDGVGLGPLQPGLLEAARGKGVDQRHVMPGRDQRGEEVLPIVPGRLHDDERRRRPERRDQRGVALLVLGDHDRPADRRTFRVEAREHVALRGDVDACEHGPSVAGRRRGASEPPSMLALVQARTQAGKAWPRDTVRALNAGRGRQSQRRGPSLEPLAATLSQHSMRYLSQGAHR
ncbi:MAG TPA: hypothetical protein VGW14_06400 [Thermoleophilaceae bacterium]|nr:hypothetical protein [Thermoleophilaceae bacterium]